MMHQCGYCPESFFSSYSLASHMRIHTSKEPHKSQGSLSPLTFAPPSSIVPQSGQQQVTDYSTWPPHQSWQWNSSISATTTTTSISKDDGESEDDYQDESYDKAPTTPTAKRTSASTSSSCTGKIFECPSCKKGFRSYPGLRYHRNAKHDQNGPYKCSFCDKRFCQKSHLNRHVTLHTGEKEFGCTYCQKTFRIKGNLQIHLRIHTGEKPYECKFKNCGKKFTQQQSAKSHEKLHLKYK